MADTPSSELPTTSIVLVSFHTGPALFLAIHSVLEQKAPIELIIVDNGNPEDVLAKLRDIARTDKRVLILSGHGNVGFARANNIGVQASRGDYLLLLNPDCKIRPNTVEKIFQYATCLERPYMLGARILNEDGTDQRGSRRALLTPLNAFIEALPLRFLFPKLRLNKHLDDIGTQITSIPAISGAFIFIPRMDFALINGFDEGYFLHVEDLDLCFRFQKAGGRIYFLPDVIVTHIGGTSDAPSEFVERHKMRGFIRYFHQNFGTSTPIILLWCLDLAIWIRYFIQSVIRKLHTPKSAKI